MPTFTARYRTPQPCKVCGIHVEAGQKLVWSRRNRGVFYHDACFTRNDIVETKKDNGEVEVKFTPKAMEEVIEAIAATPEIIPVELPKAGKYEHYRFPMLLALAKAHSEAVPVNIWLVGPAGSGKTKACEMLADALGISFYFTGAIAEPYSLLGYNDANGRYVRTTFREAYENGGVFLLDEVDGSQPNALLTFNAALANGHCAFPDGVIKRHAQCIIVAAANTFGLGGTSDYVGRVKLDAATLSRFVWLEWGYDEKLERRLAGNDAWFNRVLSIRNKAKSLGLKVLVTPRATYTGAALLRAGLPQADVEEMTIRQGMTLEQWNQIKY